MGRELGNEWRDAFASALEWWRDAGVDSLVEEAPRDWLARPAPKAEPERIAPALAPAPVEVLPDTLEAFVAWRLGDAAPEAEWLSTRVAPAGPIGGLMILTDMPEADDREALLGGAAGRLLDRMLAAIGESRDSAHVASLAVARPITGQIPIDAHPRLGALARHHIALVAPKKLLLLGQAAKRALDAASGSETANGLSDINLSEADRSVVAIDHPRFLLERPIAKAEAWRQLLSFSRGTRQ